MRVCGKHLLTSVSRLETISMPGRDRKSAFGIKIKRCCPLKHFL